MKHLFKMIFIHWYFFVVTLADKSEYTRSRWDRGCQPINSIASDWPLVDCRNIWCQAKTRNNQVSRLPGTFLSLLLMVCTACSASPFEEGWYGAYLTCLMPLRALNFENIFLLKLLALSDMITGGLPCVANVRRNTLSVSKEDGDNTTFASI